jgi:hypothetical protein
MLLLLVHERRAGRRQLDVALPVAAEPRAAERCVVSHG